jgi:hypothetical protein
MRRAFVNPCAARFRFLWGKRSGLYEMQDVLGLP